MPQWCTSLAPVQEQPIFILGILPRCGTNFLWDLFTAHPDCAGVGPIHEDFLVYHARHLIEYADSVYKSWNRDWGAGESLRGQICENLGAGVCRFLMQQAAGKRAITKTPRVDGLEHFFALFPHACLVILVRDGRAVVESGVKSFGWYRESAIRRWARSAERIDAFNKKYGDSDRRYCLVRYEDLWTDQENELRRIFKRFGLDADVYDFEGAAKLPLRGSSILRDTGKQIHWKPVEKPADFDALARFRHWGRARHLRFNDLAGTALGRFGYSEHDPGGNRTTWAIWHRLLDIWWLVARSLGSIYLRLKGRKNRR